MEEQFQESTLLTREQKTGLALLGVVSVLIITLWVLQVRYTIYSPFSRQIAGNTEKLLEKQTELDNILDQRDTDQDGITDYEEIELYLTSAYLPDTDSDGLTDKQEITLGSDPNCPKGTECESADVMPKLSSTTPFADLIDGQSNPLDKLATGAALGVSTSTVSDQMSAIVNNPDAIRSMLLETGQFTQADLAQIPDATLIEIAKNILQGSVTPDSTTTP